MASPSSCSVEARVLLQHVSPASFHYRGSAVTRSSPIASCYCRCKGLLVRRTTQQVLPTPITPSSRYGYPPGNRRPDRPRTSLKFLLSRLRISDPSVVTFLLSQATPDGGSGSRTKYFAQVTIPRFTSARISEKYTKMKKHDSRRGLVNSITHSMVIK